MTIFIEYLVNAPTHIRERGSTQNIKQTVQVLKPVIFKSLLTTNIRHF